MDDDQGTALQPAGAAFVTEDRLHARLLHAGQVFGEAVNGAYTPMLKSLSARIRRCESLLKSVEALPGSMAIAEAVANLEATLRAPVKPTFDSSGRINGAQRVPLPAGASRDPYVEMLERRIEDLETRPRMDYRGVWKPGIAMRGGEWCTDRSSLWICLRDTSERPGESHDYQLACKGR